MARFEYRPWIVRASRMLSNPAFVFGPVLNPPWSRQRPFGIAGHWQGGPCRVLAPHRLAFAKSPAGLPFFSPRRFSWGSGTVVLFTPTPHPLLHFHRAHNRLPAVVNVNVLHRYLLLARFAFELLHRFQLVGK